MNPDLVREIVRLTMELRPRPSQVNISQAAEMLGLSRPTVRKLISHGNIRTNACGLIPVSEIDRALAIAQNSTHKAA